MKKVALTVAVLGLGLAACQDNAADNADSTVNTIETEAEADMNAVANGTDNAMEAAGNAVDNAANAVENAGNAVENATTNG
jgi:hypothetical protein